MQSKRKIIILAIFILAGIAFFLKNQFAGPNVVISDVKAIYANEEKSAMNVFFQIENLSGPDILVKSASPNAKSAEIISPSSTKVAAIPELSKPSFSSDGVYVQLSQLDKNFEIGEALPIEIEFQNSGTLRTRAIVNEYVNPHANHESAASVGLFGLGNICRVEEGEPEPKISLNVTIDGDSWTVKITTEDFTFAEPTEGLGHTPGYGHGHLYLDGLKLQRLYEPEAKIGKLLPGRYTISVTLNTNDHRAYVVGDAPVSAEFQIVVDE